MPSKVTICNMALGEIAAAEIQSIDEQSLEAKHCNRNYDQVVSELLEAHEWSFANRRVELVGVPNSRLGEWLYAYAMPAGVGTPRRVLANVTVGNGEPVLGAIERYPPTPFIIESGVIYTNQEGAIFEYGAATVAEAVMSGMFVRALVLELAARIVMPIKKDRAVKGDIIKQAEAARERAIADEMNRQPTREPYYVPESLLSREGYGYDDMAYTRMCS